MNHTTWLDMEKEKKEEKREKGGGRGEGKRIEIKGEWKSEENDNKGWRQYSKIRQLVVLYVGDEIRFIMSEIS